MAAHEGTAAEKDPLLPQADLDEEEEPAHGPLLKLMVGAVGVVYGDIGTSPLYTMRECFEGSHGVPYHPDNVKGLVSLVFWALIIVVTLKYVSFIMRADNRGEGGILSLMTLARRGAPLGAATITVIGLAGASLFYGDAVITPAISVLSAVEGLSVVTPGFERLAVPLAVIILVGLFLVQRTGTGRVGAAFGPIMVVWFTVIACLGIYHIAHHPSVLLALSPVHAVAFFWHNGFAGFAALGAVVLAVTGGEALYADMGHFGRRPMQLSWLGFVLPALALNYLGQAALVLAEPEAVRNPFFEMVPDFMVPPLVVLATIATVIASQAVISGTYSVTRQAMQLGFWPRTRILHTSAEHMGQIYLPQINWALMVAVVALTIGYGSSSHLASAYGIAVTGTMSLTTILALNVAHGLWGWKLRNALLVVGGFIIVDLAFLGANLLKIVEGGWMPLLIGCFVYLLMTTWRAGKRLVAAEIAEESVPLGTFFRRLRDQRITRVPGTAVYLTSSAELAPHSLILNTRHNKVLHERIILLTISTAPEPRVPRGERSRLTEIMPNVLRVDARFGFMQQPSVPQALGACRRFGLGIEPREVSYFIGREVPIPTPGPGMPLWRERLFAFMVRNATNASEFFRIPKDQVLELGTQVPI